MFIGVISLLVWQTCSEREREKVRKKEKTINKCIDLSDEHCKIYSGLSVRILELSWVDKWKDQLSAKYLAIWKYNEI